MVKIKINGIPVDLPYEPYPAQLVTMENILACLSKGESGLIESPTGTGKSLSIICSVLAYREHTIKNIAEVRRKKTTEGGEKEPEEVIKDVDPLKIIICSRTHKQLDQLVNQLRKTRYKPRMSILASRTQYCINPKLKDVGDKNSACSELVKANNCMYFTGKDRLTKRMGDKLFDIEELVKEGKKCAGCPYFASRRLNDEAEIIFAPYNYLLDSNIRETTNIDLKNAVVIIDEAHNVDDVCRASGSLELGFRIIEIITNELMSAIKKAAFLGDIKMDFINLLELFRKFVEHVPKITVFDKTNFNGKMRIRKGKEIKKELDSMGITKDLMVLYKNSLYSIVKNEEGKSLINVNTLHALESVDRVLSALHFNDCDVYAFVFHKEEGRYSNKEKYSYNFWLLDGAYVFRPFVKEVRALALLSGTLSPFVSFSSELGHKFEHEVVAPHLITDKQIFISCLKKGHLKQEMVGNYKSYESITYLDQVAKVVVDTANKVKDFGGTLLFVPSYSFLDNITKRINLMKIKNLLLEPKSGKGGEFDSILKKYHSKISAKEAVVLGCVYRGKASEGVDFKDSSARAVICVGIPYPSLHDAQIELKKEYNDKNKHFNGRRWYETQAFRAVNQAVGRAIRHKEDWGIVMMLDSRYQDKRIQNQLSGWVSQHVKVFESYEDSLKRMNVFLDERKKEQKEPNHLLKSFKQ
ncbi:Regulator of telomere elongation helicase 1 [Nosema granulosis]|uniref:DNA 5'-3' helicase n=1 Tax=Nosema granulosis TaxID=83296 RepID=A0A9P6H146_9MICR|nr:Regulator of telomere elongation helicase 1 [Nosema granulosis]